MADVNQKENFIQLKKDNILKIGIKDAEGNDTGEHLEFDLESVEYPLKLNECDKKIKKITSELNAKLVVIKKRQDVKGKYILSKNQEDEIRAWKEFYDKGMEAFDGFFGKDGCKKLLNGREPYYTMFNDFADIAGQIVPQININAEDIKKKIKSRYSNVKEKNVLE